MKIENEVGILQLVDNAKFNNFHWKILFWCLLLIIFDGYDLVIYGVALPLLMMEWGLTAVEAGMLASVALFGMMFGAMILGTVSDKIGRKRTIIICVLIFSGFTFLGGFLNHPIHFGITRFIAGLGIGGLMPNVVALMTEYAPKKIRSTLVATMFSGYAIGGMLSALLGSLLVVDYGWRIMFYIGGAPLILIPFISYLLPESLVFLIKKSQFNQVKTISERIYKAPVMIDEAQFILELSAKKDEVPLKALFQQGRAFSTLMFWTAFFMCLLMVYALGSWLPKLMLQAGYSLGTSMMFLFALNIGGMIGAIGGGLWADRYHIKPVLTIMFFTGGVALILLGFNTPTAVLYGLIGVAGAATIGSQILLYTFVAQYYPAFVRSTGMGWASGIGRMGAIIGPVLTGGLLTLELTHQFNFIMIAIPGLIASLAIGLVSLKSAVEGRVQESAIKMREPESLI